MRATGLHFSATGNNAGNRKKRMDTMHPEQIVDTVRQAQVMTIDHWWNLLLAFLLGGFTSAMWTWREARRRPHWNEIVSTFFVTGLLAVAFAAYLIDKVETPMVIVISILCGFSGDSLVRLLVRGFRAVATRMVDAVGTFFGARPKSEPPPEE
jgi:ABC-type uncharacterized transport system permease subunit